ncbi:hypothetical protein [Thiocapsa sp.]|uniref:hypothetical protein n=1 Tax=Thiocapsa sp. TaxID=2024551 RepID=UPI0026024CB3|nr:hypothetical protein [Thiocapsa sp.]
MSGLDKALSLHDSPEWGHATRQLGHEGLSLNGRQHGDGRLPVVEVIDRGIDGDLGLDPRVQPIRQTADARPEALRDLLDQVEERIRPANIDPGRLVRGLERDQTQGHGADAARPLVADPLALIARKQPEETVLELLLSQHPSRPKLGSRTETSCAGSRKKTQN